MVEVKNAGAGASERERGSARVASIGNRVASVAGVARPLDARYFVSATSGTICTILADGEATPVPIKIKDGYETVRLRIGDRVRSYFVHRFVWEYFHERSIPDGMEIDHLNRFRDDNRPRNLSLVTWKVNQERRRKLRPQKLPESEYSLRARFGFEIAGLRLLLDRVDHMEAKTGKCFFRLQVKKFESNFWDEFNERVGA